MSAHAGVIDALVAGTWRDPADGRAHGIPVESIVIADTLEGREADLVRARHGTRRLAVVHDAFTREALGGRVLAALRAEGAAEELVWERPRCTPEGAAELSRLTEGAEALVAVGSGTVSDACKYATFLDGREYSVFATSPMNAYTTPTASVAEGGFKRSLTCHSARGVFFDLGVLSRCPPRLVSAAFADVVCRTTAQADWLMSHLLLGTPYRETAYTLLSLDEGDLIARAGALLDGDRQALATLTRVSAIMGLSTSFTGTTHVGSMAEHMISHAIDMWAAEHDPGGHPGTSHGEQVGVATLIVSRLQEEMLGEAEPPALGPTEIPRARLVADHGEAMAATMIEQAETKALDEAGAERMGDRLRRDWGDLSARLRAVMRPHDELRAAMAAAGCQLTGADLGLSPEFTQRCVRDARFVRDRFTMLDLAGDSGRLEPFARTIH